MGNPTTAASGSIFNNAAGITITAPNAVFAWIYFAAPNALATQTNGGLRFLVGSSNGAFKQYYVRGSDSYAYGGWECIPFHPSIETGAATINVDATAGTFTRTTGDFTANGFESGMTIVTTGFTNAGNNTTKVISSVTTTVITVTVTTGLVTENGNGDEWVRQCDNLLGSPTTTAQWFGGAAVLSGATAVSKGNPFGLDAIRWGRGESRMYDGESADPASFAGFATNANDTVANRLGLIQEIDGGFLIQGKIVLGYSAAVYFKQENTTVLIADTEKVVSSFNAIEIRQPSGTSTVIFTNVSFLALNATARGNWITTDNATVTLTACTFTSMGTFGFLGSTTATTCTFRACNLVTQSSAVIVGCTFDSTNDATKGLLSNNPANVTSCIFKSSGTKHGIEFNTPGTYTWAGNTFTGYASSDGSSGNEAVYNNCTPYNTTQTYASSNQDSTVSLRSDAGGDSAVGECFASTATKVLSAARFYLKKSGTPTGNATVKIYAVTGTPNSNATPTGAVLATSENFSVASLTGSYAMTEFKFKSTNCISLTSGTNYFVVLDVSATTSSSGNTIDVGYDNSAPSFTAGNAATYSVTGAVWTSQSYDLVFDCYTDGAVILNLSAGGTTPTIRNATGCSTSVVASVDISVYVVDTSNSPLNDVQVAIFRVSDDFEIMNKDTGYDPEGNGYATTSYNGATPANIYIRVRKASTGTKYIPVSSTGTIQSEIGYTTTVTLQVDTNA
jgi:hypothetical protein